MYLFYHRQVVKDPLLIIYIVRLRCFLFMIFPLSNFQVWTVLLLFFFCVIISNEQ